MSRTLALIPALLVTQALAGPQTLSDPTRPVTAAATTEDHVESSRVQLEAVLNRSGSYVAIVNGKLVRAGDHLGNITIQEVTADSVRYMQDGKPGRAQMPTAKLSVRHDPVVDKEVP